MPNITIFKSTFVESLRIDIPKNLERYLDDSLWVTSLGGPSFQDIPTSLGLREPLLDLAEPEASDHKDIDNAIRLHKAMPEFTRLQARDPRLWTRLAHIDLWPYMRKRWPIEKYMKDGVKVAQGRVLERYFVAQSQSRALMRNGIARLWWGAYLTHEPNRSNPYELTAVLFYTLDIAQQILERGLGRAPGVLTGFLEFLLKHQAELLTGGEVNRTRIRTLAKFLNMHGGVCILDCLTKAQVIDLLEQQYAIILERAPEARTEAVGEEASI
jgi:hypothetical protein